MLLDHDDHFKTVPLHGGPLTSQTHCTFKTNEDLELKLELESAAVLFQLVGLNTADGGTLRESVLINSLGREGSDDGHLSEFLVLHRIVEWCGSHLASVLTRFGSG